MKKYFFVIFIVCLFFQDSFAANNWNISKSTHFIVYYQKAPNDFVDKVVSAAEDDYNKIADGLGFRRYDFWLWDDRGKIYIYDDALKYQEKTGQPLWSSGCAFTKEKTIHTFVFAKNFIETILGHELGHIIFREFVGFNNPGIPLWLDEGVASYQEKSRYSSSNAFILRTIERGEFMDLKKLSRFSILSDLDSKIANIFYAESFSLVDFLIKEFGRDKFVLFCQNLRNRRNLEESIRVVYNFATISEFDQAWQKDFKK